MTHFNPIVKVKREKREYGGSIEGIGDLFGYKKRLLLFVEVEGTAEVEIEMPGWDFISSDVKASFEEQVKNFKFSHKHGPDNFDDKDRDGIKRFVEALLRKYYHEGKIILV